MTENRTNFGFASKICLKADLVLEGNSKESWTILKFLDDLMPLKDKFKDIFSPQNIKRLLLKIRQHFR